MAVFDMQAHTWRDTMERTHRLNEWLRRHAERDQTHLGEAVRESLEYNERPETQRIGYPLRGNRVAPLGWSSQGGLGVFGVMGDGTPNWEWRPMQRNADGTYPTTDLFSAVDNFERWSQNSYVTMPSGVGVRLLNSHDVEDVPSALDPNWTNGVVDIIERRWAALSPEERENVETELAMGVRIERLERGDYDIPPDDPFFEAMVEGMVEANTLFWAALPETRRQEIREGTPLLREAARRLDASLGTSAEGASPLDELTEDMPTVSPDALDELFANIDEALEGSE